MHVRSGEDVHIPLDLDAERAVIGAMCVSEKAIGVVAEIVEAQDFYSETHRVVYRAILELTRNNQLVDQVTLARILDEKKMLVAGESARGFVFKLYESVPTASGASRYAEIVKSLSFRRELMGLAAKAETAARRDEEEAIEAVEELHRAATRTRADKEIYTFSSGHEGYNRRVVSRMEGVDVMGIPTGLSKLDKATTGWHDGDLVILAARPGMAKTLYLWQGAITAARHGYRAFVMNLEMAYGKIQERCACATSSVSYESWRRGRFSSEEGNALLLAYENLTKLPLYMHNPKAGRTVEDLRRAVKALKPDIVFVDYLQLLATTSASRGDRYTTVTLVSADLKQLAVEENIPIVCAAQLSREVEKRFDKRPVMSDLRECVVGDTRVVDAESGTWIEVKALRPGMRVMAVSRDQKIRSMLVRDVWSTGVKPVFDVTTQTGRRLRATANHPLLTATGWKCVEELQLGDVVGTAMRLPRHGEERHERADLCRLLGYMVGDGTYQKHRAVGFISSDPATFEDAVGIVKSSFPGVSASVKSQKGKCQEADFVHLYSNGYGKPGGNALREWLREIGCFGQRDSDKRVARFVFEAGEIGAREFLAGYLSSDGSVKKSKSGQDWSIHYDSVSRALLEDVQALLIRLGIVATIGIGYTSSKGTRPIYRLQVVRTAANLSLFGEKIRAHGKKGELLRAMRESLATSETNPGIFALPREVSAYLGAASTWRDQGKRMRRSLCLEKAENLSDKLFAVWANSDLLWEKIRSIEPAGEEEVFDLNVPAAGNFIANGIVAHNSGQIEQDADVVLAMYRDAYYYPEGEREGKNGPEPVPNFHPQKVEFIARKDREGGNWAVDGYFEGAAMWLEDYPQTVAGRITGRAV